MLLAKFPERVLQHSTGKRRCGDVDVVACCQKLLRLLDEISKDVCGDERSASGHAKRSVAADFCGVSGQARLLQGLLPVAAARGSTATNMAWAVERGASRLLKNPTFGIGPA